MGTGSEGISGGGREREGLSEKRGKGKEARNEAEGRGRERGFARNEARGGGLGDKAGLWGRAW